MSINRRCTNDDSLVGWTCTRELGHFGMHHVVDHGAVVDSWHEPGPPRRQCESTHTFDGVWGAAEYRCKHPAAHAGLHFGYDKNGHHFQQWRDPHPLADEPEPTTATVDASRSESLALALSEAIARRERAWAEYTRALDTENIASAAYYAARAARKDTP